MVARPEFEEALRATLNQACAENGSDTPDFILATYLLTCLDAFNAAVVAREAWYNRTVKRPGGGPGWVDPASPEAKPKKHGWPKDSSMAKKVRDLGDPAFTPPDPPAQPVEQDTFDDRISDHSFVEPTMKFKGSTFPPDVCQYEYRKGFHAVRMCHRRREEHTR